MSKPRLLFLFLGSFSVAFAFGFMIGTSLLQLIPFFSELLLLSGENFTIYYGLSFFKYLLHHAVQLLLFGSPAAIFPGILLILTVIFAIAMLIASFFKKRNEMMFYVPFVGLMSFGVASLFAFFFGIKLYDGTTPYNYFQLIILNKSAPVILKVFFIVIFVAFILTFIFELLLIIFVFVAPAKTEKYLAKQYEKEFATIREVRQVSNEEFGKYIREHVDEIRDTLGIANNAPYSQPTPAPAPAPAPTPAPAPINNAPAQVSRQAEASAEPAKEEPVLAEAIAEPVEEVVKEEPKAEETKTVEVPNKEKLSNEEIAMEIAKAVALSQQNAQPGTKTIVSVKANGSEQQITTQTESLEVEATSEAVAEPVIENKEEKPEAPKKRMPPVRKSAKKIADESKK